MTSRMWHNKPTSEYIRGYPIGYVLSGKIGLVYDGKCFNLSEGGSYDFDSRKQHQVINRCQKDAVVLAINFNYRRF